MRYLLVLHINKKINYNKIEIDKILQVVIMKGTDFLANVEPRVQITFSYELYFSEITVGPEIIGTSDNECEKLESPWRDAVVIRETTVLIQSGLMLLFLQNIPYTVLFRLC